MQHWNGTPQQEAALIRAIDASCPGPDACLAARCGAHRLLDDAPALDHFAYVAYVIDHFDNPYRRGEFDANFHCVFGKAA